MTAETKTSLARVCAVMVPKEAQDIEVTTDSDELGSWSMLEYGYLNDDEESGFRGGVEINEIDLPAGNWQILGELGRITEEQAALVMPSRMIKKSWDDHLSLAYENPSRQKGTTVEAQLSSYVDTALEALSILADSMEVYAVNPYGEEPVTKNRVFENGQWLESTVKHTGHDEWQRAQSRTGRWIILYEPKKNK